MFIPRFIPRGALGRAVRGAIAAALVLCIAAGCAAPPAALPLRHAIAAAHPLAAEAGLAMLRDGGRAVDAAIAAQLVLTLVEPQSSGIGGGGFLVHYRAADRTVVVHDGRETAPAGATADQFLDAAGRPLDLAAAAWGGRAVGVPGVIAMLAEAHREHGRLPWARLFDPAIALARDGFAISPRLARAIASEPRLGSTAATARYFLEADGTPKAAGTRLRNPALATTLAQIAAEGPDAFYRGDIAAAIVAAVADGPNPGTLSHADLAAYRPVRREPVCGPYRVFTVCGVPPPSAGGIAVLQILAFLARFDADVVTAGDVRARHLFAEANRLAYADRDRHVADPAFVAVPTAGLLDPAYLARRARLIDPARTRGPVPAGTPGGAGSALGDDNGSGLDATSHLSVVDGEGNAVALTTTVESVFGAKLMAAGFVLNNQLTDFAFRPESDGRPVANRLEPGKRPRSAMSPTVVLDPDRRVVMTLGSPGGSAIIAYVARTIVATLDGRTGMQRAIAEPNIANRNGATEIERGSALEALAPALEALGHGIARPRLESGLHGIRITAAGLDGGADPRREGVVRGD